MRNYWLDMFQWYNQPSLSQVRCLYFINVEFFFLPHHGKHHLFMKHAQENGRSAKRFAVSNLFCASLVDENCHSGRGPQRSQPPAAPACPKTCFNTLLVINTSSQLQRMATRRLVTAYSPEKWAMGKTDGGFHIPKWVQSCWVKYGCFQK